MKRRPVKKSRFSKEEIAVMRESLKDAEGEKAVLAKIASMKGNDKILAKKIHTIVRKNAPTLMPKTWYGMPSYANKDGKAVIFFQDAAKFGARYATLGFNDKAMLDDGSMWPTSFAIKKLTAADEANIAALVKKAVRTKSS